MKSKRVFAAVLTAMLSVGVCLTPMAVMAAETTPGSVSYTEEIESVSVDESGNATYTDTTVTKELTGLDLTTDSSAKGNTSELVGNWSFKVDGLKDLGVESIELALTDTYTGTLKITPTSGDAVEEDVTYTYDGTILTYETENGVSNSCMMASDKQSMTCETLTGEEIKVEKVDDRISIGSALLYALIGFAIVFFVLLILNLFIRLQSVIVRAIENKTTAAPEATPAAAPVATAAPAADGKQVIPAGMKVADGSLGDIKLYNVDDATAAMIMAIVADKLGVPLNELRFKSIKEVTK